jgi:hypothetical protein
MIALRAAGVRATYLRPNEAACHLGETGTSVQEGRHDVFARALGDTG